MEGGGRDGLREGRRDGGGKGKRMHAFSEKVIQTSEAIGRKKVKAGSCPVS